MAEVKLELGGIFDVATSGDVADIARKVDGLAGALTRRDPRPLYRTVSQAGVGPVGGGQVNISLGGPASGRMWDIRQLITVGADAYSSVSIATVVGVAANTATLTLPPGAQLQSFVIESANAAAAVSGVVTVSNGAGGQESFEYTFTPNGSVLTEPYSPPLEPSPPTAAVSITMPAVVGGSAYTITAQYTMPVSWYISVVDGPGAVPGITELVLPGVGSIPVAVTPGSSESLFLHYSEHLICQVMGVAATAQVLAIARVAEWIDTVPETRRV